jgi:thiamine monophosphate kinase
LLFTVPGRRQRALSAVLKRAEGLPCTRIGTVTADRSLTVIRRGARAPIASGFAHFR